MSLNDLYHGTTVPLPSLALRIVDADSAETACKKIDRFFDDLIRNYPPDTREVLRNMYYENANIYSVENAPGNRMEANWRLHHEGAGIAVFEMLVDVRLCESEIFLRCTKIHEIAGHIGQAHERLQAIGFDEFMHEVREGTLGLFLEQSIAPAEKMLVDVLPMALVESDLLLIASQDMQDAVRTDIMRRKSHDYDSYIQLTHRQGLCAVSTGLRSADHNRLHARPDLQAFGRYMAATQKHVPSLPKISP
jgi:hypothetical protein